MKSYDVRAKRRLKYEKKKEKKKRMRKYQSFNLVKNCAECGTKLRTGSKHHWLCNKCWRRGRSDNVNKIISFED